MDPFGQNPLHRCSERNSNDTTRNFRTLNALDVAGPVSKHSGRSIRLVDYIGRTNCCNIEVSRKLKIEYLANGLYSTNNRRKGAVIDKRHVVGFRPGAPLRIKMHRQRNTK